MCLLLKVGDQIFVDPCDMLFMVCFNVVLLPLSQEVSVCQLYSESSDHKLGIVADLF